MTGNLPTHCESCGTKLANPHALQPYCAECKYIRRNERLAAQKEQR